MTQITGQVLDSAGRPADGVLEIRQTARHDTASGLVASAWTLAKVVAGDIRAEDGTILDVPPSPADQGLEIIERLKQIDGTVSPTNVRVFVDVPDVASIDYGTLVTDHLIEPVSSSPYAIPEWASDLNARANEIADANMNPVLQSAVSASRVTLDALYRYRGVLPNGTDMNTLINRTDNGLWEIGPANTHPNLPFTGAGHVIIWNTGGTGQQQATKYGPNAIFDRVIRSRWTSPVLWQTWEKRGFAGVDVTSGANLDDYRTPGDYMVQTSVIAGTLTNWPADVTPGPAWLRVRANLSGVVFQHLQVSEPSSTVAYRATVTTTGLAFGSWKVPIVETTDAVEPALANQLRIDDWSFRRGGVKSTGGKGAVALRFDHGLNNFNTTIRPLLEARGLPYALVLNSRLWSAAENNAVTAATVDGWVTGGLAEVWNHSATHADANTYGELYDTIVNGLTELRAQIPSAEIDGFAVPGVGGGAYGGFGAGATVEDFYSTITGRLILEHHAVSTGAFPWTSQRVLDGRVRQGQSHYTIDARTPAQATGQVDQAVADKTGIQFMMHPSYLNSAGYMTTADLTTVLDHIVTQRDAGNLVVLSPYDLLLADAN